MEPQKTPEKLKSDVSYYVLAGIFISIVLYDIANSVEPIDDTKFDFFEVTRLLGFGAASVFAFLIAKRYWGSRVFGIAYLSLAIGYVFYFSGDLLWYVYEIGYQVQNPYPYFPDIGYFGFYPFAIYHLRINTHYFKPNLEWRQKMLLIVIPLGVSSIFAFGSLVPMDVTGGISQLKFQQIPDYDQTFYIEFLTGLAYVAATTLTFSFALIGFQVFRTSILGAAWGLLLLGIALNSFADVHYYYTELFGDYDRANPVHGIWMASTMVLCYALYKHRSI